MNTLRIRIFAAISGIVSISLILTLLFFQQNIKRDFLNILENKSVETVETVQHALELQYNSIKNYESAFLASKKRELANYMDILLSSIDKNYSNSQNGEISENEAKKNIINIVNNIRIDNNIGYFWISSIQRPYPQMIVHPLSPELNGTILDSPEFNKTLDTNENLFAAAVDIGLSHGSGYVSYTWPKPVPNGLSKDQSKISFIRYYEPWDWIIGTGLYTDDIKRSTQERIDEMIDEMNDSIMSMTIGQTGYYFIFKEDNHICVHPSLAHTDGNVLINPDTGGKLLEELKAVADKPVNSLEYTWDKPGSEGNFSFRKKAHVVFFAPLSIYIGSTYYLDEFDETLMKMSIRTIALLVVFLLVSVLLSLIVTKSITRPIRILIRSLSSNDENGIPLHLVPETHLCEIDRLGTTINTMLKVIISDRKQLEKERDYSMKIIDKAPYLICGFDRGGRLKYMNPACSKTTGASQKESEGMNWIDFLQYGRPSLIDNPIDIIEQEYQDKELPYITSIGEVRSIIWNHLKISSAEESNEIILFGHDITVRKKQEVELENLNSKLRMHQEHLEELVKARTLELQESLENLVKTQNKLVESEKMASLGGLVAGVAHEINTPVGISITAASLLDERLHYFEDAFRAGSLSRGNFEEYIQTARDSSNIILVNMEKAANLIKSFKQVAVDQSCEEIRSFNILIYLNEILASLHPVLKKTNIDIVINCPDDIVIENNPGALSQIITNLIMNSLKHGFEEKAHGMISILVSHEENLISFIYKDNGAGIPAEYLHQIFEPFFTTKRGQGGSGLGMHIVYNLVVQTLGGTISCDSTPGEGTEFVFSFPYIREISGADDE